MPLSNKAAAKAKVERKKSGKVKKINLALQGGGSHGAFTWGVLDRLLEEESIQIEAITGTSAGGINGALVLYGLDMGGPQKARQLLQSFWKKISTTAALISPMSPSFFERMLGASNPAFNPAIQAWDYITKVFSPYQLNVLDINPLRDIVEEIIDFKKLRNCNSIKLFVNATNVKNGKIRVFERHEMTVDMLMASACLPMLYKTVEVNGEYYWDGGYSGNPALYPLIYNASCRDIIIVQVNPINIEEIPTTAPQILDRMNEISFNSTLMREVRAIAFVTKLLSKKKIELDEYKKMHLHMIEAEDILASQGHSSKYNADWDFLQYLKDIGRQAADDWINENYSKLGVESSIDVRKLFLD